MVRIFINYVSEDRDIVKVILQDLNRASLALDVFMDTRLVSGEWRTEIFRKIDDADFFLSFISTCALRKLITASVFREELDYALARQQAGGSLVIVPVLIEESEIPDPLSPFHGIRLFDSQQPGRSYDRSALENLLAALDAERAIRTPRTPEQRIDGTCVSDLPLLVSFLKRPLRKKDVPCEATDQREIPPPLQEYFDRNVAKRVAQLRAHGHAVTNGLGYSLRRVIIDKGSIPTGGRYHWPRLYFEPADYFHQVMYSERLDEAGLLEIDGRRMSIREFMNVDFDRFTWPDVSEVPIPQRFASCGGLIVPRKRGKQREPCLVVAVRARQMMVAEKDASFWQASMSFAEGMLREDDSFDQARMDIDEPILTDGLRERAPSPFNTAIRALREELHLRPGVDYDAADLRMLTLAYDSRRCQPVAVFVVETDRLCFADVLEHWHHADDRGENKDLIAVPLNREALSALIEGKWKYRHGDWPVRMFSNHQLLGACVVRRMYT